VRFQRPLVEGRLLRRYKRFLADVELASGEEVTAHCPNPGSMATCMVEGGRVLLSDHEGSKRKLRYGWELSEVGETWVLVNTAMANPVVGEALRAGRVPELAGYAEVRAEVRYGERSRVDRHLQDLLARVRVGERGVLLFLVSRGDTELLRPAANIDPDYAACLQAVAAAGVEILAYRADVGPEGVELADPVPVDLDPAGDDAGPLPRGKAKPNRPKGGWST
jgi:sugar fermentation stimulation protein A